MAVQHSACGWGAAESQGLTYSLEASDQIAIRLDGELVDQNCWPSSLLRSGDVLAVDVAIPWVPPSRYDIDGLLKTAGQALVAGGLIDLSDQQLSAHPSQLPLSPRGVACSKCPGTSSPVRRPGL